MRWWLLMVLAFAAAASPLSAEPPTPFLQTGHVAWKAEDDAPSNIEGIAQTPDGFLWLATGTGLYRFDGLTFQRVTLAANAEDVSLQAASIAAAPNGDVWIGYASGGMARYHAGRLERVNPAEPSTRAVYLTVTPDGAVWARVKRPRGNLLVRYRNGRWEDIDERWNFPLKTTTMAMLVARDGSLYLLNPDGLRRLPPGGKAFEFQALNPGDGATIAEDGRGRIWLANTDRLARVQMGAGYVGTVVPLPHTNVYRRLAFAPNGMLWMGGTEDGAHLFQPDATGDVYRAIPGAYAADDGLSSNITLSILKDREGNVWLGTLGGLDRFAISRSVVKSDIPGGYTVDSFTAPSGKTYLISGPNVFVAEKSGPRRLATIPDASMICGDHDGLLIGALDGLYAVGADKPTPIPMPRPLDSAKKGQLLACTEDQQGRLVVSVTGGAVQRREAGQWRLVADGALSQGAGALLFARGARDEIYVVYKPDTIGRLSGDRITRVTIPEKQMVGFIRTAARGRDCMLFGAQNGLLCLTDQGARALSASVYPELLNVSGIYEAPDGWTWLGTYAGILRARTEELRAAFATPGRTVHFERFGSEQGLRADQSGFIARAMAGDPHGRLWVSTTTGVVSIDMTHADARTPAPIVVINAVSSNGQLFPVIGKVTLPVGTKSLQIDYTATALADPKGTRFRYRLEGVDKGWTDAGQRRQAIYTNIAPGRYVFRVAAQNSAGVASKQDAVIDIVIKPSFFQTWLFYGLVVALMATSGWLLYRWRLQALASRIADRLQERTGERERIARELHDTLLQGFQGLILRFQSVANRLPKDGPLRLEMDRALDRAEVILVEGRNRVRDLRAAPGNLSDALTAVAKDLAGAWPAKFTLTVEGAPRALDAAVNDEMRCIGEEAIRNAFRHAKARTVEAALTYRAGELRLHVRDDGVGLPAEVAANGGVEGHFGLVGMRERAIRFGGALEISSRPNAGTEIVATIPGSAAYARESRGKAWWARLFDVRKGD